jgi:hypothetical protein
MKTILAVLALSLIAGCSTLTNMVSKGAEINDAAALAAEVTICRGISIGAWMRAYGQDANRAKAWKVLCDERIGALP